MDIKMKDKKWIRILILILTIALIWGQSCLPPEGSSAESGWVKEILQKVLGLFFGKVEVSEMLIRKLGHFTEYMILGIELTAFFPELKKTVIPMLGFGIAFLDETIQIFSGRGPQIQDVWIDLAGALVGMAAVLLIRKWRKKSGDHIAKKTAKKT